MGHQKVSEGCGVLWVSTLEAHKKGLKATFSIALATEIIKLRSLRQLSP